MLKLLKIINKINSYFSNFIPLTEKNGESSRVNACKEMMQLADKKGERRIMFD